MDRTWIGCVQVQGIKMLRTYTSDNCNHKYTFTRQYYTLKGHDSARYLVRQRVIPQIHLLIHPLAHQLFHLLIQRHQRVIYSCVSRSLRRAYLGAQRQGGAEGSHRGIVFEREVVNDPEHHLRDHQINNKASCDMLRYRIQTVNQREAEDGTIHRIQSTSHTIQIQHAHIDVCKYTTL